MDTRSLTALNTLHPDDRIRKDAIEAWQECEDAMPSNVKIIVVQGYRSIAESTKIYNQGRTTPGEIVTYALPGHSWHNYAMAFDFAMVTNGKDDYTVGPLWMKVVAIMKKHGWTWGGDFPPVNGKSETDNPHFEKKLGYTTNQMMYKFNAKQFITGTQYIKI